MSKSLLYAVAHEHRDRTGHDPIGGGEPFLWCDVCICLTEAKREIEEAGKEIARRSQSDLMNTRVG